MGGRNEGGKGDSVQNPGESNKKEETVRKIF